MELKEDFMTDTYLENGYFLGEDYFERLLSEIRGIRLSKRRFYQKMTNIS